MNNSSNLDQFSFCKISGKRKKTSLKERGKNLKREKRKTTVALRHETQNISHFSWIYIRAIKWISRFGLMEALKHLTSLRRHNNWRICSCSRYARSPILEFTPKLESTPHAFTVTRIYRRIDVSPYNWLQQYSRKGDREAFHSVAFLSFFPSYLLSVLLFCKLQHWSPFFFSTLIVPPPPTPSVLLLRLSLLLPIRPFAAVVSLCLLLSLSLGARRYLNQKGSL